jgi:subtilisin family serine protease
LGGCFGNNNPASNCKVIGGIDFCADDSVCNTSDSDPMDVNGHGTHVSGIAAANGSITGVAPDAKIIMIKASNSTGNFADDDLIAAINWCVDNSTLFNISVISMSLGGDVAYNNYCDSEDSLTSYINSAFAKNISVAAASGNDYYFNAISGPACIQNSTAVGSSTKSDSISLFSNTWNSTSLLMIVAPGESINSTWKDGGYNILSGTSMATPHVSGAIAIINQYLVSTGQKKTPLQIKVLLNNTGKQIYEPFSNRNFSRIDIYSAIISTDNQNPIISLMYPTNNLVNSSANQTFRCNATDLSLRNVTFYLWNSTSLINQTSDISSGAYSLFEINISNLPYDSYKWNCLFTDENNNRAFASSNFSLTITNLLVILDSPINNIRTKINQTFGCNASSPGESLANITFYIWNSTGLANSTMVSQVSGNLNSSLFYYNFSYEDNYNWNCLAKNSQNQQAFASANFSISYDISPPQISVISPINNSWYNSGKFNVSLNENGSCQYSLDYGANNFSLSTLDNQNFNATNSSIAEGNYNISFYCNDSEGNQNSAFVSFKVDLAKPEVNISGPLPIDETGNSVSKKFYYNVSDNLNITRCELILNGQIVSLNSSSISENSTNEISYTLSAGVYSWSINCTDEAGNVQSSGINTLVITAPAPPSGGGSGGGGGGTPNKITKNISSNNLINQEILPNPIENKTSEETNQTTSESSPESRGILDLLKKNAVVILGGALIIALIIFGEYLIRKKKISKRRKS